MVRRISSGLAALLAATVAVSAPAFAQASGDAEMQAEATAGGPWHFRSIPCSDAVVKEVGPRLAEPHQTVFTAKDYEQSGVTVVFRHPQPWHYLGSLVTTQTIVTHYQDMPGNALMRVERPGDRVQICLTGFPLPLMDPSTHHVLCDPDKDPRGFTFRVYDYRRHAAYIGMNSEHDCGGA